MSAILVYVERSHCSFNLHSSDGGWGSFLCLGGFPLLLGCLLAKTLLCAV